MSRAHCNGYSHQRGALEKIFEYRQERKEEKIKGTSKKSGGGAAADVECIDID